MIYLWIKNVQAYKRTIGRTVLEVQLFIILRKAFSEMVNLLKSPYSAGHMKLLYARICLKRRDITVLSSVILAHVVDALKKKRLMNFFTRLFRKLMSPQTGKMRQSIIGDRKQSLSLMAVGKNMNATLMMHHLSDGADVTPTR